MKRKIIQIDEEKCNGCAACTKVCAEAALEMVDGKAKVISDFLCDGMGACLDVCPVDALKVVEKDTDEYDPQKTYEHVKETRGEEDAQNVHGIDKASKQEEPMKCGCPGSMMRDFTSEKSCGSDKSCQTTDLKTELRQWPIQLHLLHPGAPYLQGADLVISADCAPFAYANFHQKFLKDKILAIMCPKLDDGQDEYVEKLTEIFNNQDIKSITIVHMEVPCCGGIEHLVKQALDKSGKNITIKDYTVSVQGELI
ncbi:4Fe-4S dicluster domain-containing protein [Patescibacteria group bacterium]|nr:4Fe-4S dicluster domain-containing protein [Patescibacteria group bacterium]